MLNPALLPLAVICLLLLAAGMADLFLMLLGAVEARRWKSARLSHSDRVSLLNSPLTPAVAVLAAPPDASAGSLARIQKLLQLHSADVRFVVMLEDPCASDLALWTDTLHLQPANVIPVSAAPRTVRATYESTDPISLLVVETEKGHADDSLNIGLQFDDAAIVATVDLSAEYSDEALMMVMMPFLAEPTRTSAVCAAAQPTEAPGFLSSVFRVEFQRTWLMRVGLSSRGVVLPSPGAIALFRREAVVRAGGFGPAPLELILRLQQLSREMASDERVVFLPIPASRPRAPRTRSELRALLARDRSDCALAFGRHGWLAVHELIRALCRDAVLEIAAVATAAIAVAFYGADHALAGLLLAAVFAFKCLESLTAVLLAEFASPSDSPAVLCRQFLGVVAGNLAYRFWRNSWIIGQMFPKVQP